MSENKKLRTVKDVLEWIDKDISEHREEWPKGKNKFVDGAMTALGNLRSFIEIPASHPLPEEREPEQLADLIEKIAHEVCPNEVYGPCEADWSKSKLRDEYIEGAKNGAFAMHKHLTVESKEPVYRWVKCTDRVPDQVEREYVFRAEDGTMYVEYVHWDSRISEDDYFEWLEQIPAPITQPVSKETESKPFGISDIEIQQLLDRCLKPEEIAGEPPIQQSRIEELIRWFVRFSQGSANGKWATAHSFELAYYIASNAGNRFIDLEAVKKAAWLEGVQITPAERAALERLNLIPKQSPPPIPESLPTEIPEEIKVWLTGVDAGGMVWRSGAEAMYRKIMERRDAIDLFKLEPGISGETVLEIIRLNTTTERNYEKALFSAEQEIKALQASLSSMKAERDGARKFWAETAKMEEKTSADRDLYRTESETHKKAWEEATAVLGERNVENRELKEERDTYRRALRTFAFCADEESVKAISQEVTDKYPKKEEENK